MEPIEKEIVAFLERLQQDGFDALVITLDKKAGPNRYVFNSRYSLMPPGGVEELLLITAAQVSPVFAPLLPEAQKRFREGGGTGNG